MFLKDEPNTSDHHTQFSKIKSLLISQTDLCFRDFEFQKPIGRGSFSIVQLARFKDPSTPQTLAHKIIQKFTILNKNSQVHLQEEHIILKQLDHPFVVKFIHSFQDEKSVCFVFEFIPGGDIYSLLASQTRLSESWTRFYVAEILVALRYLHSKKIIYRDLKPENVMIDETGHVKLVDFGFAKRVDNKKLKTLCGTPEYMAPEILLKPCQGYTYSADFWSLGVLVFELLTGFFK